MRRLVHGSESAPGDGTQEAKKAGSKLDAALDGALRISCVTISRTGMGRTTRTTQMRAIMARAGVAARLLPAVGWEESVVWMAGRSFKCPHILLMCAPTSF